MAEIHSHDIALKKHLTAYAAKYSADQAADD